MDTLFAAAIAGDADARKKLEMEADRVVTHKEYTILHTESRNGKAEHVRFILREFANKNLLVKFSKFQESALHLAAENGHTEVAEVLIDAARSLPSSSANTHNPVTSLQAFLRQADIIYSETALHAAVAGGYFNIVQLLLAAEEGYTEIVKLIYIAVEEGYTEIVKLICTTCTVPSLAGPRGSTALHAAIKNLNHGTEVVELLIGAGSSQDFLRQGDHEDGNTALHIAVMEGNVAIVKLLLEAVPTDHRPIQNKKGETPIYIAAEKGYTEIVKLICTTCKTLSQLTAYRHGTALQAAIKNLDDSIEVLKVLINAARLLSSFSYSFQDFLGQGDENSNTVIHIAVIEGNLAIVKLLLDADPGYRHSQNNQGKTPIYIAVEKGYNEIVKVICTTCTAPSLDGPGGSTALHAAILNNDEDLTWMMFNIAKRENISSFENFLNKTDEDGRTILELAVERN